MPKENKLSKTRAKFEAIFSGLAVTEEYHGYPGAHLMASLQESAAEDDRRSKQGPDR